MFTKWLPAAILDDRKLLSIAFLAILDQYTTFFFGFYHKITFDRISRHFRSIRNFNFFFHKMAAGAHFGLPKFAFDRTFHHFRSMRNFFFFQNVGSPICAKNNRVLHYVLAMAMPNMKLIGEFVTQLEMPQAF